MPILIEDRSHWVTAEIALPSEQNHLTQIEVRFFDSQPDATRNAHDSIYSFIQQYVRLAHSRNDIDTLEWPPAMNLEPVPVQMGSSECGIHVIHTIHSLIQNTLPLTSDHGVRWVNERREEYTRAVVEEGQRQYDLSQVIHNAESISLGFEDFPNHPDNHPALQSYLLSTSSHITSNNTGETDPASSLDASHTEPTITGESYTEADLSHTTDDGINSRPRKRRRTNK